MNNLNMNPLADASGSKSYASYARAEKAALEFGKDVAYVIAAVPMEAGTRFAPVFLPKADQLWMAAGLAHAGFKVVRM